MSLFTRGQALLNRLLAEQSPVGSAGVTYTRVGGFAATLPAWVGRTLFALDSGSAARVEWGERDYLVSVAAFEAAFGPGTLPARGDRITEEGAGIFELQTPTGEAAWRYSDQTRTLFRLHCQRVT